MELLNDLKKMDRYIGKDTDKFQKYYKLLFEKYPDEESREKITGYVESALGNLSGEIGSAVREIGVKVQLIKAYRMVSMSYISRTYFNRTRQWLYQKINGSIVNGKPASFTDDEIKTLNFAIQDMSKQLASIRI